MPPILRSFIAFLIPLALAGGTLGLWEARLSTQTPSFSWLISGDLFAYFLPSYTYQAERLAEWRIPLWNPYQAVGQPFLATLQPGVLYPARLLLLALSPKQAIGASLGAHLVLLVVTTYAFARALRVTRLAASGAAIVLGATLGGTWFYWPCYLEAGAWWPLLALALVHLVRGAGWRWVVLLGVGGAMPVLAGGYQMTLYMAYALLLLAAGLLADSRFRPVSWTSFALRLGVAGLIAVATAAPQLLPTLAWSAETARRTEPLTLGQLYPLGWPSPWEMVRQTLLDAPGAELARLSLPAVGVAAFGFARQRVFGLVMGGGALLLYGIALGPGSPVFPLYRLLPLLEMYRFPFRLLTSVYFLLAAGVALGLDACQRWRPPRWPLLGSAAAAAVYASLLVALVIPLRNQSQLPWLQGGPLLASLPVLEIVESRVGNGRAAFFGSLALTQPRFTMLGGMRGVQDYEPLASRRLQHFLYAVAGEPAPGVDAPWPFLGFVDGANPLARPRLLDLVATTVVIVTQPTQAVVEGLRPVSTSGSSTIYLNPHALPRAYTVPRAHFVASEDAALGAIQATGFDPQREAVLVGSATGEAERAVAAAHQGGLSEVRISSDAAERVELDVDVTAPAVLVLADAFAPGWEVFVDGRPRRLWQANHLVRGVVVTPGDRRVSFVYRAPGWRLGWVAFGAGWLVAAVVMTIARRMR